MLKITIDNTSYEIEFEHKQFEPPRLITNGGALHFIRGATICRVIHADKSDVAVARCSCADQFNKATGRKISLTRALTGFPRKVRKQIWQAYWATGTKR